MIVFESVWKTYPDDFHAVKDLSMEVAEGETLVLLGTSGSGKTTTMKMVNRLIEPSRGRISIGGEDIMKQNSVQLRRRIGYAIQHIGLFPHMNVGENIAVVPRLLRWDDSRIEKRIDELLTLVGLDPEVFRKRYPQQLSGGQRQRIGVARALAADPPLVLMDEPFGALDPITREQLQSEFLELQSKIQKTVLFVTHDIVEAVKMGDRVAILNDGALVQIDTPYELIENPANEFVNQFLGVHRFQLSLITHTIGQLEIKNSNGTQPETKPEIFFTRRTSLIDALDRFKQSQLRTIPVYENDSYIGVIDSDGLLYSIKQTLGAI